MRALWKVREGTFSAQESLGKSAAKPVTSRSQASCWGESGNHVVGLSGICNRGRCLLLVTRPRNDERMLKGQG